MIKPEQRILLVSTQADTLADALTPFLDAGFSINHVPDLDAALAALDPGQPPALVLLDARNDKDGAALREDCMRVLAHCALTWVAAISPLRSEDFHAAMEGLGMLPPLPPCPTRSDGESLLEALRGFLPRC